MDWKFILISVISNALFIALATAIVNYFFNKKLESAKQEAAIYAMKYQTLHTKRAEAIELIYSDLDSVFRYMTDAINPWQLGGDESITKKVLEAQKAGNAFIDSYSAKKIYLKPELEKKLDEMHIKMKTLWAEFIRSNPKLNNNTNEDFQKWEKAWQAFSSDEVPVMLEELKKEFRKILGSELD